MMVRPLVDDLATGTVAVEAGTFETEHFRLLLGEEPIRWISGCLPEDVTTVKVRFDVIATTYQLMELERWTTGTTPDRAGEVRTLVPIREGTPGPI